MKEKLTIEAFYPDPPERVWRALTDAAALQRWLMPTTFKAEIGFRFRFKGTSKQGAMDVEGVVIELDAPNRLAYTWDDGEDDTPGVVAWTLKPKDGGTQLTLEHSPAQEPKPYVLIEASTNWRNALHTSLPILLRLLQVEERRPLVPIVYVTEGAPADNEPKRRAGFRQEEATCIS